MLKLPSLAALIAPIECGILEQTGVAHSQVRETAMYLYVHINTETIVKNTKHFVEITKNVLLVFSIHIL